MRSTTRPLRPSLLGAARFGLAAACLWAALAGAPARASYMIPGSPWRAKDFAFVKKDGVYHLFYIRNNASLPLAQTELDFGHAVSTDLYHWTQLPPALTVGTWDNAHVWAPTILERDGVYWMFYTGVTTGPGFNSTQRTGAAVSLDLITWRKIDGPQFSAQDVPWAWWQPTSALPAFRDPFVMPDPQVPGGWLMYYTGNFATDTTGTVIGVASSTGDLEQWSDLKPLWITHHSMTFNTLTESPHVFEHDGLWYLFITTNSGQPLTFYTSTNPTADPAGWTYRGRLRNMLGYDTSFWFASEALKDGTRQLFAFVSGDRIEIREVLWTGPWQFALVQPPLLHVTSMTWLGSGGREGDTLDVRTVAANPFSGVPAFEAVVKDSNGAETAYPVDSLGMTEGFVLFGDTTVTRVRLKRLPSRSDTTSTVQLKLRTTDRTAETGWVTVLPPVYVPPPPPPDSEVTEVPPYVDPIDIPRRVPMYSVLARTPLGPGPAVALELEAPGLARVDVFDLMGRKVSNLADRVLPKGLTVLPWDGRDASGMRAADGVYFARAVLGDRVLSARLLLLRR